MHIYLETGAGSGLFNRRGEAEEFRSFARKMQDSGLRVIAVKDFKGDKRVPLQVLEDK